MNHNPSQSTEQQLFPDFILEFQQLQQMVEERNALYDRVREAALPLWEKERDIAIFLRHRGHDISRNPPWKTRFVERPVDKLCPFERDQGTPTRNMVMAVISKEPQRRNAIAKKANLPQSTTAVTLTALHKTGRVARTECGRWLLPTLILLISLTVSASTNTPPPVPAAPATTNATPVAPTFRVPLVWTYILNPSNDIPNTTVVQFRTNTASVFSLNQPAYVGTNRMTLNLPAGDWRIDVYGETGSAVTASATIFGTAADGIEVVVSDFAKTTNRVVYSGPPMPGTNGLIRAWNTHKFTQK